MQHFQSLEGVRIKDAWLTIGAFDGVHIGHQAVIRKLIAGAHAAGAQAVVLTFFPHPAVVLGKRREASYLTTPQERAQTLDALGVDLLITLPFDQDVAQQTARQFLNNLLAHLNFQQLWVGHDFAMGHNREGNVPYLRRLGNELGYLLHVISPVEMNAAVVSSSRIRALLAAGDVEQAARLLGRAYRLDGEVIRSSGRDHSLGAATANLAVWEQRALPGNGVYVCKAQVGTEKKGAVTHIGVRPTFEQAEKHLYVETHLLDIDLELQGQHLQLEFLVRLRDEQHFRNPQERKNQIQMDIKRAREYLDSRPPGNNLEVADPGR